MMDHKHTYIFYTYTKAHHVAADPASETAVLGLKHGAGTRLDSEHPGVGGGVHESGLSRSDVGPEGVDYRARWHLCRERKRERDG